MLWRRPGRGKILRQFPLNGGIDLCGIVMQSNDSDYHEGDEVLVCGCGLSEIADGGYAEVARVKSEWVVPLPSGLSPREAMAIGTAGFTAALAVARMEQTTRARITERCWSPARPAGRQFGDQHP